MKLVITTHDCRTSKGFVATINPVVIALRFVQPSLENVEFHNGRITATRAGYPVRFAVKDFSTQHYRDLVYGSKETHTCTLDPLPVTMNSLVTH